jgi:hypothetical protein
MFIGCGDGWGRSAQNVRSKTDSGDGGTGVVFDWITNPTGALSASRQQGEGRQERTEQARELRDGRPWEWGRKKKRGIHSHPGNFILAGVVERLDAFALAWKTVSPQKGNGGPFSFHSAPQVRMAYLRNACNPSVTGDPNLCHCEERSDEATLDPRPALYRRYR